MTYACERKYWVNSVPRVSHFTSSVLVHSLVTIENSNKIIHWQYNVPDNHCTGEQTQWFQQTNRKDSENTSRVSFLASNYHERRKGCWGCKCECEKGCRCDSGCRCGSRYRSSQYKNIYISVRTKEYTSSQIVDGTGSDQLQNKLAQHIRWLHCSQEPDLVLHWGYEG